MLAQISDVALRSGYVLHLRFDDGTEGDVDISTVVSFTGVFSVLADHQIFEQVKVDPTWGTICWPGDIDLAPEPLYERIVGTKSDLERDPSERSSVRSDQPADIDHIGEGPS